jgi:F0F1-type ATP synthase epsilon subunit
MNQTLHVRIVSPRQLILDTQASSVSSENVQGNFDILPQHANFITLIENSSIIVRPASQREKPLIFKFPLAILVISANVVNIYTYIQPQTDKP